MLQPVNRAILAKMYKRRPQWSHKGNFGRVLVIGGSKKYSGSPAFNALAAIRAGADLVTVLAPRRAADIIATFSPDLITQPLAGDYVSGKYMGTMLELAEDHDAVVIGGGLERRPETLKVVAEFIAKNEVPCVIDADALHAIKKLRLKPSHILTPHSHEFFELTGIDPVYDRDKRVKQVSDFASAKNCTVLLKGSFDIVSDGKDSFINMTGNPYMTKGGTGDTLAGICGAYLARGVKPLDAACAAAYVNGVAGTLAARRFGESLMASDLIEEIPRAIR
jgi:NAD(P)H-hydrate epimerase